MEVSLDAVKAAKWLKGEAPASFEPGHVYIFEAWATWCGPCIRVIPHMNELHKKYHEKGLRVYGMNVFEDGEEKVAAFVTKKGDEMSYPVAYTGKGSPFALEWMKAAGVRGIPHSFIVIDGKLVIATHPASITDELIEKLLKGGDDARQAIEERGKASAARQPAPKANTEFKEAASKGDLATMERLLAETEKKEPKSHYISQMKVELMFAKKQWPELDAALVDPPTSIEQAIAAHVISSRLAMGSPDTAEAPKELHAKTAAIYEKRLAKNPRSNPIEWVTLSRLQFLGGDIEAAKKSAQSAVDKAKEAPQGRGMLPAVFEKFSAEVTEGRMPTTDDFGKWVQESAPKP